jgi:hypothetical protein
LSTIGLLSVAGGVTAPACRLAGFRPRLAFAFGRDVASELFRWEGFGDAVACGLDSGGEFGVGMLVGVGAGGDDGGGGGAGTGRRGLGFAAIVDSVSFTENQSGIETSFR